MPPFLLALLGQGLNLVANGALAKGKEWVEEKTGVKLRPDLPLEDLVKLKQFELEHEAELQQLQLEENKLDLQFFQAAAEAGAKEDAAVTTRWQSDMASDSWLSKNIRPSVLLYLLSAYTLFSVASAFGLNVNKSYVELLGQWGMLVMTAYFGGRSVEKVISIIKSGKEKAA